MIHKKHKSKTLALYAIFITCFIIAFNTCQLFAAEKDQTAEDEEFLYGEDNGKNLADSVSDPMEFVNRATFTFNDKLYFWVLKPVAQGYKFVTPSFFRTGVRNFFTNITMPARLTGCVMQGKRTEAEAELARFLVNSTFGLAGIFDLTSHVKEMNPPEEDIGQALGSYGIGSGFYIMWPFLGPSTIRDTTGTIISFGVHPMTYMEVPLQAYLPIKALDTVNGVSDRIGDYESVKEAAFDPYIMIRDGYIQRRNAQIRQ